MARTRQRGILHASRFKLIMMPQKQGTLNAELSRLAILPAAQGADPLRASFRDMVAPALSADRGYSRTADRWGGVSAGGSDMRRIRGLASAALLSAAGLMVWSSASCSKGASTPASPTTTTVSSAVASYTASSLEQQTHARVNAYRVANALAALGWNDAVAEQARKHSSDMASGAAAFGHDGFSDRVTAIGRTMALSGAAENVAMTSGLSDPASAVVTGWLNSATHKPNIDGDYGLTGIGVAISSSGSIYFTQIFVKAR
jgi:uncharacterized protein YkwD